MQKLMWQAFAVGLLMVAQPVKAGYTADNAPKPLLAQSFQIVNFQGQQKRPSRTVPVFTVKFIKTTADGTDEYGCKPIPKKFAPIKAMVPLLPSAQISGVYRKCELVQLDFGDNQKFWFKYKDLVSKKSDDFIKFMKRGSKKPYCFSSSKSLAGSRIGKRNASTRSFC